MLDYEFFYNIADYGNANWKGAYTPKEVASNAYEYLCAFEESKAKEVITPVIQELAKLLAEDGSEECKEWLYRMVDELGLIDMDWQDYLDTDEWLKEFM